MKKEFCLFTLIVTLSFSPLWSANLGVSTDDPRVTNFVIQIQKDGGNAADAMVAGLLALGVVNPSSSGLGGGGFCLAAKKTGKSLKIKSFDFRESAPDMLSKVKLSKSNIKTGAYSVGVPGEAMGILRIHESFGKKPLSWILDQVIKLAEKPLKKGKGLKISLKNYKASKETKKWLSKFKSKTFNLPGLIKLLKTLKAEGIYSFYKGEIAKEIVKTVQKNKGILKLSDLQNYRVKERKPLVFKLKNWTFYIMPPPSSGGIALNQIFSLYEASHHGKSFDFFSYVESSRFAFRDRAVFLGDPDFVKVPVAKMLNSSRLKSAQEQTKKGKKIRG